jgi:hypothetical protein
MGSGRGSGVQEPGARGACRPRAFPKLRGLRNIPNPLSEEPLNRHPGEGMSLNLHTSRVSEAEIGTAQRSEMTRRIG